MEIVNAVRNIRPERPCAMALGNFDGVHIGHLKVIEAAAKTRALSPAALTFQQNPHPVPSIVTPEDKEEIMRKAGVQLLVSLPFAEVCDMPAEDFFRRILLEKCRAKKLCCGKDFRFGQGAGGDYELLHRLCQETGTQLEIIPYVTLDGQRVSSTRIRKALQEGDVTLANRMLGRPFGFELEVIHGNHIGRGLGTPTINQALPEGFILPKFGVYASVAEVDGVDYYGVTNIGVKPTVGSDYVLSETWMPEFHGDLYGKRVRLSIYAFIRPERKFDSLEEMKAVIVENTRQAKDIIGRLGE